MQCVFSFGNRSVPNAKIVALSEINLAFGLKNGPAQQGTMAVALMANAVRRRVRVRGSSGALWRTVCAAQNMFW